MYPNIGRTAGYGPAKEMGIESDRAARGEAEASYSVQTAVIHASSMYHGLGRTLPIDHNDNQASSLCSVW
jgi:hypothetical protein